MRYDRASDSWSEIERIPLSGTEGPFSAVPIDQGFFVPQYEEGVFFDCRSWHVAAPPGFGSQSAIVWTGEEILMWGSDLLLWDGRPAHLHRRLEVDSAAGDPSLKKL